MSKRLRSSGLSTVDLFDLPVTKKERKKKPSRHGEGWETFLTIHDIPGRPNFALQGTRSLQDDAI